MLIETKKLHINDIDTVSQFSTFVRRKNSYEAEPGYPDDAVMALMHCFVFLQDRMGYEHKRHLIDGLNFSPIKDDESVDVRKRVSGEDEDELQEDGEPMPFGWNRNDFFDQEHSVF